jgi:hypothetical protein
MPATVQWYMGIIRNNHFKMAEDMGLKIIASRST